MIINVAKRIENVILDRIYLSNMPIEMHATQNSEEEKMKQ